jgi:hypothetical protein
LLGCGTIQRGLAGRLFSSGDDGFNDFPAGDGKAFVAAVAREGEGFVVSAQEGDLANPRFLAWWLGDSACLGPKVM